MIYMILRFMSPEKDTLNKKKIKNDMVFQQATFLNRIIR